MDSNSPPRTLLTRAKNVVQWTVFTLLALFVVAPLSELRKAGVPGAPTALLYTTICASVIVAFVHLPSIFSRFPKGGKIIAYLLIVGLFMLFGTYLGEMEPVWEKTPEGAKEAADHARTEAQRAETEKSAAASASAENEAAKRQADLQAEDDKRANDSKKLDGCFSFFGHNIPALTNRIRNSLENPHSFELVKTEKVGDGSAAFNVRITFRAENGFGALRTYSALAMVKPEDCSAIAVGNPEN